MRHPLITPLASRDGSVDKDEKLVNCYGEQDPVTKETFVFKRAGIDEGDAVITGNDFYGQGAFSYGDDLFVIIDDILFRWDYVGGLDYGGDWVYVFGSQSGAGGAGGGVYYVEGSIQDYDISVTYDVGDSVIYEGVKYYAHGGNTGVTPGSDPYTWQQTEPGASRYHFLTANPPLTCLPNGTIGPDCATPINAMQSFVDKLNSSPLCTGSGDYVYFVYSASQIYYQYKSNPASEPYTPNGVTFIQTA